MKLKFNILNNKIFKGFSANVYGQLINIGIQLLSIPLFLSFLSTRRYGEWLILSTIPAYLSLSDVGFTSVASNQMALHFAKNENEKVISIFNSIRKLLFLISVVVILIFSSILVLFDLKNSIGVYETGYFSYVITIIALSIYALLSLYSSLLTGALRAVGCYALGASINSTIRLFEWIFCLISLWLFGLFEVMAFSMIFARVIGNYYLANKVHKIAPWLSVNYQLAEKEIIKSLLKPSLAFASFPLGLAINLQGSILLVGMFFGAQAVSIFSITRTLSRLTIQAVTAVNQAYWPEISAAYGCNNLNKLKLLVLNSTKYSFWVGFSAVLFLMFFYQYLVKFWTHGNVVIDSSVMYAFLFITMMHVFWQSSWVALIATNRHEKITIPFILSNLFPFVILSFNVTNELYLFALILCLAEIPMLIISLPVAAKLIGCRVLDLITSPYKRH